MFKGGKILENQKNLNVATQAKLGSLDFAVNGEFRNPDDAKITKLLTVSAKPVVENVAVNGTQAKIEGSVTYEALAILEGGELASLTTVEKFSQDYNDGTLDGNSAVFVLPNLNEVTATGDLAYTANITLNVYSVAQNMGLSCASVPEGVFTREGEVCYSSLVANVANGFSSQFELPKDNKFAKILFTRSFAEVKSVMPSTDYFAVMGETHTTIIYQADDGQIRGMIKDLSFTEEVEAKGTTKESTVQAYVTAKETAVKEDTDKNMFVFDVNLSVTANVFNKTQTTCVVDAYSVTNQVNITTTSFDQDEFYGTKQAEENLLTTFTLGNSLPQIDKVLAITPLNISTTNVSPKQNEALIEGITAINLVYFSEDEEGNKVLQSVDVDVPFSTTVSVDGVAEGDNVIASVTLGDVNVKVKHGRELEILAEIKASFNVSRKSISAITTNIELGEPKDVLDYSLEVYLTLENETLWDVAKKLNISTADLVSQNGELSSPIAPNTKIVVYHQRTM